ncbi:MAG: DUF2961 domain-containing protein, partial [Pirellulaceae bacterium]|nr:DUF2961 domain-containing protein [Pirellulaceae bacterium]
NDRVFIDGEAEPRLTGTGTEDYFNDAWGFRVFNHPYAGCTLFEGRSIDSRISAYRWHIRDPIPFQKSIHFTIENKGWVSYEDGRLFKRFGDRRDNYSSVAFWYQDKPAVGVPAMPPLAERMDPELYFDVNDLERMAQVGGNARGRLAFARPLMPRRFFHLQASDPDAMVTFPVKVAEKGRYGISLWRVGIGDGGIYEVGLNGKVVEPRLDFYNTNDVIEENGRLIPLTEAREYKLGLFYLEPGVHQIRLKCVGRNPQSHLPGGNQPGHGLGLHALSLRKVAFENMDQYLTETNSNTEED